MISQFLNAESNGAFNSEIGFRNALSRALTQNGGTNPDEEWGSLGGGRTRLVLDKSLYAFRNLRILGEIEIVPSTAVETVRILVENTLEFHSADIISNCDLEMKTRTCRGVAEIDLSAPHNAAQEGESFDHISPVEGAPGNPGEPGLDGDDALDFWEGNRGSTSGLAGGNGGHGNPGGRGTNGGHGCDGASGKSFLLIGEDLSRAMLSITSNGQSGGKGGNASAGGNGGNGGKGGDGGQGGDGSTHRSRSGGGAGGDAGDAGQGGLAGTPGRGGDAGNGGSIRVYFTDRSGRPLAIVAGANAGERGLAGRASTNGDPGELMREGFGGYAGKKGKIGDNYGGPRKAKDGNPGYKPPKNAIAPTSSDGREGVSGSIDAPRLVSPLLALAFVAFDLEIEPMQFLEK